MNGNPRLLQTRNPVRERRPRNEFVRPLAAASSGEYQQLLQGFRDRLSGRTMAIYGVPLRLLPSQDYPSRRESPDVRIGRIV